MLTAATHAHSLAVLRATVAALGERTAPPWWRTQFLSDVGVRFMGRVVPRTALPAAVLSAAHAARSEHDARLGLGGRAHLFRFFAPLEDAVVDALREPEIQTELSNALKAGKDGLLALLEKMAAGRATPKAEGPVALGPVTRVNERTILGELAAHYLAGGRSSALCLPYFDAAEVAR